MKGSHIQFKPYNKTTRPKSFFPPSHSSPIDSSLRTPEQPILYPTSTQFLTESIQENKMLLLIPTWKLTEQKQKLSHMHSRENIQINNKKYRDIRSSKYSSNQLQRALSTETYQQRPKTSAPILAQSYQPIIKGISTPLRTEYNSIEQKKQSKTIMSEKTPTKPRTSQNHKLPKSSNIFIPQMQSQSGLILHKFKTKLGKKCVEDNVHVMASVLRKKIKTMKKDQMMHYIHRLAKRNYH